MIAPARPRKPIVNAVCQQPHPERPVVNTSILWDRWVEASEKSHDARLAFERMRAPELEAAWLKSINAASDAWEKLREVLCA